MDAKWAYSNSIEYFSAVYVALPSNLHYQIASCYLIVEVAFSYLEGKNFLLGPVSSKLT